MAHGLIQTHRNRRIRGNCYNLVRRPGKVRGAPHTTTHRRGMDPLGRGNAMGEMWSEAMAVVAALQTNDSWEISQAMRRPGAWLVGFVVTLGGGLIVLALYKLIPFLERNLDRTVMVTSYLVIAAVIFIEVFRRFVLSQQAPWSTTLPPFLFLIMAWFGCAYNVRLRTHLAFAEFRTAMGRTGQFICLILDAVLWFVFSWIVVVGAGRVAANSAANFQILLGTDDVLQWWFLISVPIAFVLLTARVLENLLEDIHNYRSGEPMIRQAIIGGQ